MKQQVDYTEADRLYGAWLALKGKINRINYGQARGLAGPERFTMR